LVGNPLIHRGECTAQMGVKLEPSKMVFRDGNDESYFPGDLPEAGGSSYSLHLPMDTALPWVNVER